MVCLLQVSVFIYLIMTPNITILKGAKNRAILPSFPAVMSTPGDVAMPPVHFLWELEQVDSYNTD